MKWIGIPSLKKENWTHYPDYPNLKVGGSLWGVGETEQTSKYTKMTTLLAEGQCSALKRYKTRPFNGGASPCRWTSPLQLNASSRLSQCFKTRNIIRYIRKIVHKMCFVWPLKWERNTFQSEVVKPHNWRVTSTRVTYWCSQKRATHVTRR